MLTHLTLRSKALGANAPALLFMTNHYRNFKHFYLDYVKQHWNCAFPKLPSYQRFIEWMPSTLVPLCVYLKRCFGNPTGIGFVDATSLQNLRFSPPWDAAIAVVSSLRLDQDAFASVSHPPLRGECVALMAV